MSLTSQGQGWWQANDGLWYAPQQAPGAAPPPPQYVQGPKPKKKLTHRPLFWIGLVILVFLGGCIGIVATVSTAVHHVDTQKHTVAYSVTGSGVTTASITYSTVQEGNGQKGTAQVTDAPLPWSKTITASGIFSFFDVSVTNGPAGLSYVTCTLTVDGKVISTNKSSGPYATADCSGGPNG